MVNRVKRGWLVALVLASTSMTASGADAQGYIEEKRVSVSRSQLDALERQHAPAKTPNAGGSRGFASGMFDSLVKGNGARQLAAKAVLEAEASVEAGRGRTVVVVIGDENARTKTVDSLSEVQRPILLMIVDPSVSDDQHDNTAFGSGLVGMAKSAATNLWVYYPSGGTGRRAPNVTLSTKVISPKIWAATFAANGDVGGAVKAFRGSEPPVAGSTTPAPRSSTLQTHATSVGGFSEGDALVARLAGIRLLSEPVESARVVATLDKAEEVIVTGTRDGFVQVTGVKGSGWVNPRLFTKP